MHKIRKGSYGYIASRRQRLIVLVVLMLALVLAVYFGALAILGTNQNWFTVLAALICLPTAQFAVRLIMFLKASGCSAAVHEEIAPAVRGIETAAYDLYMTTDRENYALSHVTVAGGSVIAFTEDPKCDCNHAQTHIRHMMQGNGYHGYTVKVFHSLESYLLRLGQLHALDADENAKDAEILQLLAQISL